MDEQASIGSTPRYPKQLRAYPADDVNQLQLFGSHGETNAVGLQFVTRLAAWTPDAETLTSNNCTGASGDQQLGLKDCG